MAGRLGNVGWNTTRCAHEAANSRHPHPDRPTALTRSQLLDAQTHLEAAHRVTEIAIDKALHSFGDVIVVHQALKKPPPFENRGATGVSVINGTLREVCSAKVRRLGEKVGQAWRLHVHLQDSTKAAYVCSTGEVKWNLTEIEVPTVEHCIREDAIIVQDIRELGMGWAWCS